MLKNKTAEYIAKPQESLIEITQLKSNTTIKVGAYTLLLLLKNDFAKQGKYSIFCPVAGTELTLGSNMHLRTKSNEINTYLTKEFKQQLIKHILDNFPNIEKSSKILSEDSILVKSSKKNNLSIKERLDALPLLEFAFYEEPYYDDANCNGYHMQDFIGVIGKNDEIIEISFQKNDELFAPRNGKYTKNFIVGSNFNLYNQNRENLGWTGDVTLVCTYGKKNNIFEVNLLSTKEINYFGKIIKAYVPKQIAVGILPEKINYVSYKDELINEKDFTTSVIDEEELPW